MSILSFLHSLDVNGVCIHPTFNGKGTSHSTIMGGFLALISKLLIYIYFIYLFDMLVTESNDDISLEY